MIRRVWIMLSGMFLVLAAFFVWRNNFSGAFVTAALGACSWFLSYRGEMKKKIADDDTDSESDESFEDDHEE
jgi:hypothetical protein